MGTSPKSSFFQRLARGLRPNGRSSATGSTIGKHNGETKRETTEKNEKWKNIYLYFSIYLFALKYCLYINRRKKWKITYFGEIFFFEDGHKS